MEHLLEQGRIRMTRDFETWFLNIHTQSNSIPVPSFESIPSAVQNDAISSTEKQEQTSRVAVGAFRKQSPPTIRELLSTTEIRHRSNSKPAWPPSGMENDIYPRPKSVSSFSKPNLNPLIHIHPKTDSSITLANEEVIHINPQQKQSSRTRSRVIDDNVYKRPSSALSQSSTRSDNSSVREDIQAFYKARQELLARQGYPRE
ncbi:hypothetical protein BC833DRAFT_66741 [Globomyces pollinis-pini]|nr:hypothetical protein BC833DRAFT_66741 [Globomyces pollinis-pini]